jgi:lysyl-tRNA synthetase class 1
VIERFPNVPVYTCAAGISPSGIVHFGNFRDVMTAVLVADALRERGKPVRMVFSWDEFDRFRKVPAGVPANFAEHVGKPLAQIPDPEGTMASYAARFEEAFERAMQQLGVQLEYRYQAKEYQSGRYDDQMMQCLKARTAIAEVMLSFMSDKGKAEKQIDPVKYTAEYYPINLYSRFTGKDSTKILNYDGDSSVEYECLETKKREVVNLREHRIAKLAWKVDWPMRWGVEGVVFEPGGHDHASPGSSYDVSSAVTNRIFNRPPPVFVGYQFIGLQGLDGKMSGSKGNAVSPGQLLEIYEGPLLKWLYARKTPDQSFSLAFNTEIFRQYDEMDREVAEYRAGKLSKPSARALELCFDGSDRLKSPENPIPFRQAVAFGQILQWDGEKVRELSRRLNLGYSSESIDARLSHAKAWLVTYNDDQLIQLLTAKNEAHHATMSDEARGFVRKLRESLESGMKEIEELEAMVYAIPKLPELDQKANSVRQRAFFKDVYTLLIGNDTGPRLSTFLWAVDRARIIELLSF